ncbi:uncharacterized protein CANTADRAFT_27444 [Suhomyces tanzawaensis NRRL Y-17324]|uniref:Uncharacterized protein n=1 Tax=Suhomyces tanzawaensis NRRL Y-17324 TaxID=984487 RepID=A0A1E4SC06_9ASCO|nr:uncharacterized protein CANTADRAFT_27444 [Suhomyces tanzawaensis NRRL Y-17324]ODV77044.1 hypothetical protein CANTADRAFT_27444 [Suhomyces tanzawaensis NRRL Y-17324]
MLLRQFPLRHTCNHIHLNIRPFKPRQRPTVFFTHSFSTNSPLQDTSYTDWFLQKTKSIPSKLFSASKPTSHENKQIEADSSTKNAPASTIHLHPPNAPDVTPLMSQPQLEFMETILPLILQGHTEDIRLKLSQNSHLVDSNFLLYVLNQCLRDIPERESSECEIEHPYYSSSKRLGLESAYYNHIYDRIPHLYNICKDFDHHVVRSNAPLQQHYIWLCYHMNDLNKLESLVHSYLQSPNLDTKTLGYIFSGFILNYEVEFSKILFQQLLSLKADLDTSLLEIVIYQLIKVDALFENLTSFFETWTSIPSLPTPTPKTCALLLKEFHKFATPEELNDFYQVINSFDYPQHHLIQAVELQYSIIKREPATFQKQVYDGDMYRMELVSSKMKNREDLQDFHHSFLRFFVYHSNMDKIQYLLLNMNHDGIELTNSHFNLIASYYLKHNMFIYLTKYLESSSSKLQFNEVYLKKLFDTFVRTYPYKAVDFANRFHSWLKLHESLSPSQKAKLVLALKIVKLNSQLTPYHLENNILEIKKQKYDSSHWKSIDWKQDKNGRIVRFTDQVQYRINKGFFDVLRKGVRPDISLVISTFRRLDMNNKLVLIDILKRVRMYEERRIELELIMLQARNTKQSLLDFFEKTDLEEMNINDRLKFARMLMNKNLFRQSLQVLEGIDPIDLDDKSEMMKLNLQLRNYCICSDFEGIIKTINNFAINDVTLSPYIYNQCCFIEKKLLGKLKYLEGKHQDEKEASIASTNPVIETTVEKLQGLIADIRLRLEKDEPDITEAVTSMFEFLDTWIEKSHEDQGKV